VWIGLRRMVDHGAEDGEGIVVVGDDLHPSRRLMVLDMEIGDLDKLEQR